MSETRAIDEWDLGPAAELPCGKPCLRRGPAGERLAVVSRGDGAVDVLDDRCPHEGYPLSQGDVRDGVLTCAWHNWKFELATGGCSFGGEAVRRYPARIDADGRLRVDPRLDVEAELARMAASLREGLTEASVGRCTRESLRMAALSPEGVAAPFEVMLANGLARERYGFDHPCASTIDVYTWVERGWLPAAPAFTLAATLIGEPLQFLPERARVASHATPPSEVGEVCAALVAERRDEAEGRVRALAQADATAAVRDALLPFLRRGLYDYGHGAIFAGKALELAVAFPRLAAESLGALAVSLSWATTETSLPAWAATRKALEALQPLQEATTVGIRALSGAERADFQAHVLSNEREAVSATLHQLGAGRAPEALLRAIARAAAERLRRFDPAWTERTDAAVGFLDVTHAVTMARVMVELWALAPTPANLPLVILAAAFVGKLHRADRAELDLPIAAGPGDAVAPSASSPEVVAAAVQAGDVVAASAHAAALSREARLETYRVMAPYAAFEAAVRPIRIAHAVKTTEALYRLERDDDAESPVYLQSLIHFLGSRVRERSVVGTAAIAAQFLKDGRPPGGLY